MTKQNVLVFPCGSEVGLEIHRSVRYSTHFQLVGASSVADHGGLTYERYIEAVPFVDSPSFASEINKIIQNNDIQLVVPAHDSVVLALAKLNDAGMLGCKLVTSPLATCSLARSKRATYERFSEILPTPAIYSDLNAAFYPAFAKPDIGQGSKGASIVRNVEHARAMLDNDPSLLLMEYLPGPEFTIDCFTDRHHELLYCEGRTRSRISNGISVRSERTKDERFRKLADTINSSVEIRGAWFFQVKARDNGELVLMEFAPRIAGTMGLSRAHGANLPLLSLFDAIGMPVSVSCNEIGLIVDRALQSRYAHDLRYDRVYLDFDDTVIIDGKVNTMIMALIHQCRNNGIPIALITRHGADLGKSLRKFCIGQLFDEVIWLKNGEEKADYIISERPIFIDDSWAERNKVHKALGIPVFDTHMIEVLLGHSSR